MAELQQAGNIRKIAAAGVMAALIFVVTLFTRIPVPNFIMGGAYVNAGDSMIYCTSFIFGGYYAAAASAIGSALADLLAGAPVYIPATFIIKGLMGLVCAALMAKPRFHRYLTASILGGAIMVAGYGLYELAVFGAGTAAANILYNLLQWAGGVLIALPLFVVVKSLRNVTGFRGGKN